MDKAREAYIERCETEVKRFLKTHKNMFRWIKDEHGQKTGVVIFAVIAGKEGEYLSYGYSLCNMAKDKFNRWIGLAKAISRLWEPGMPRKKYSREIELDDNLYDMEHRAVKYFKQFGEDWYKATLLPEEQEQRQEN